MIANHDVRSSQHVSHSLQQDRSCALPAAADHEADTTKQPASVNIGKTQVTASVNNGKPQITPTSSCLGRSPTSRLMREGEPETRPIDAYKLAIANLNERHWPSITASKQHVSKSIAAKAAAAAIHDMACTRVLPSAPGEAEIIPTCWKMFEIGRLEHSSPPALSRMSPSAMSVVCTPEEPDPTLDPRAQLGPSRATVESSLWEEVVPASPSTVVNGKGGFVDVNTVVTPGQTEKLNRENHERPESTKEAGLGPDKTTAVSRLGGKQLSPSGVGSSDQMPEAKCCAFWSGGSCVTTQNGKELCKFCRSELPRRGGKSTSSMKAQPPQNLDMDMDKRRSRWKRKKAAKMKREEDEETIVISDDDFEGMVEMNYDHEIAQQEVRRKEKIRD